MATSTTSGQTALNGKNTIAVLNETLVARLTQVSINHVVSETAWGDSDTQCYTARHEGREDATGSMNGKFETTKRVHSLGRSSRGIPGLVAKLVIWEQTPSTQYWVFPCVLLQNFQMTIDLDTKEVVEWTIDYGADGKFYRPGQSGASSEVVPGDYVPV